MESYNVGAMIRGKREALGYTRREVCEICRGEFTEKTLCRLESGQGRVQRESVRTLLALYRQHFYTIDTMLDLESCSAGKLYCEILALLFQKNYPEAQRRLELLERYVNKRSRASALYVEAIKRQLKYCMGEGKTAGEENIRFFEGLLGDMIPAGADLEKWPLSHSELNTSLIFLNILFAEEQYGRLIPMARKLLANIEQGYQPRRVFTEMHGYFTCVLIRALRETGQDGEIPALAEKSIKICREAGNISKVYELQSELLCYWEENNFFQNAGLKEQCFETAKKMYCLSEMCRDQEGGRRLKSFLKRVYNYIVLC